MAGFPIWVHTWRNNATGQVYEEPSIFPAEKEYRPTLTLVSSRLRGDSTGEVVNPYTVDDLIKLSLPEPHFLMTTGEPTGQTIPNPFEQLPPAPATTAPPAMGIQPATASPMKALLSGVSVVSAVAFLFKRG